MLDRIAEFIARHGMFPDGSRVGVAVSGGADSVFLLHALRELAPRWNLELNVVHVDHGIRGKASHDDAEFVRDLAAKFKLPFHILSANLPAIAGNLEETARDVRRGFFSGLIEEGLVSRIATAHTRNDQAETVLYRMLRGAGLAGLSGILPVTKEGLVRPLLEIERAEMECWLRERAIAWRTDETNRDLSYARNRLRHEILPQLRDQFNPRLDEALANMASLAQDEEAYWTSELDRHPVRQKTLNACELAKMPTAVARRIIRRAIERVKDDLRQIDFQHVERILKMAHKGQGHDRIQIPGVDVFRSFEWICFAPSGLNVDKKRDFSLPLPAPGSVELPDGSARITLQVLEKPEAAQPYATVVNELDWQRLTTLDGVLPSLELRNWRPGDRYRRVGQSHEQKIKLLFQKARVPVWERWNWPIITYNEAIVWIRRFGASAEFAAGPSTRVVLQVADSNTSDTGYPPHGF
jgi:tRNA(Ile)-lysidine synthase